MELLAIDHSLSVRRIIFVPWWLKFSHVLQLAWVRTFPQLSWITRSGLAPFPGCQGSCGIVPNGPACSVFSFNMRQCLKCYHVASTLTLTMGLLSPTAPFPESLTKFVATFRERCSNFFGIFSKTDT